MRAAFLALARTRGRLLRIRYGHGLSVVSVLIFCVIVFYVGQSMGGALLRGQRASEFLSNDLPMLFGAVALALSLVFAWTVRGALYQARELTILLAQPVSVVAFVLWRAVELLLGLSIVSLLITTFLWGLFAGANSSFSIVALLGSVSSVILMILGLAFALAALLQRAMGRGGRLGFLFSLALSWPFLWPLLSVFFSSGAPAALSTPGAALWVPAWSQGYLLVHPESALAAAWSLLWALLWPCLGVAIACYGFDDLRDRAVAFPSRRPGFWSRWPGYLVALFPGPIRGLLRRDFFLLIRGSFFRALVVLGLLCFLPVLFRGMIQDPSLEIWAIEFMTLLVFVVLVSAASFLCSADFPMHRRRQLIFEKAQPITGRQALWSRTWLGFFVSLPYAAAILFFLLSHKRASVAELTLELAFKGFLLMACLCHYGAVMGMKAEHDRSGTEGMAFPMIMGMVGMFLAFLVKVHWAFLIIYPFIHGKASAQAMSLYEFSEFERGAEP